MSEIRRYEATDRNAVIELWEQCGLTRPWNAPAKDIERKLADSPEWFFVVDEQGSDERDTASAVIGSMMVGYDGHRGWVNYLAVSLAHRKLGIGRRLMNHAESLLKVVGCPKLNLQVRSSNRDVLAFYRSLDYHVDDCVSLGKRLIAD